MGALNRFRLDRLVADHQVTHLIETGYGEGGSCRAALDAGFLQALSCETFSPLHAQAEQGPQLQVMLADSLGFLQEGTTAAALRSHRCLARSVKKPAHGKTPRTPRRCP
jgi:hypothetical protein